MIHKKQSTCSEINKNGTKTKIEVKQNMKRNEDGRKWKLEKQRKRNMKEEESRGAKMEDGETKKQRK